MLSAKENNLPAILIFAVTAQVLLLAIPSQAQLRKMKVADEMPEFSLTEPNGPVFTYKHNRKRVLAIAFLSAKQKQSKHAVVDIKGIIKDLREKAEPFDFVGVMSGLTKKDFFDSDKANPKVTFPILLDTEYQLWGRLGIIATPTVLIVGKDDKVLWIKAGYGYDFAPALRSHLSQVLGIIQQSVPEESTQVKTLTNGTVEARMRRHLRTARMLEDKGRFESAISEVRKAEKLDPNSIEVALELGELLCTTNQSRAALDVIGKIKTTTKAENAKLFLISGWAKRQMSELDAAEKLLLKATILNPKSSRGFYELGKVYQARGEAEKAMQSYYKALRQIFAEPAETNLSQQQ
ncbi:MAG TPA: hypothetical protein ENH34_02915 [Phycisphaerales bacterium]|nr:hypothetical protein [Phycisphaerales bacterium]